MDSESIFKLIVEQTCELLPELADHAFQRSDSLEDLGANSLDRSEILMMTLEALDLNLPAVEFHGPENIGELADVIHGKLIAV
ncbi:MAG: hypothetical protein ETSY1_46220 (plasmid) [Candidatus Entotheonella factor]|uniref:Carrier domain-containing protein n=1 Tax=Entotheonella factor TaxID=1429438 RepID=W4M1C2_ENTF1|nr:MAG: hypothetical protein ETSY1_46220 [Candidatus Entotheonella factor]